MARLSSFIMSLQNVTIFAKDSQRTVNFNDNIDANKANGITSTRENNADTCCVNTYKSDQVISPGSAVVTIESSGALIYVSIAHVIEIFDI